MLAIQNDTRADEDLLLELMNTTPFVDGERFDELAGGSGTAWARQHGGTGADTELAAISGVRDDLQAVVCGRSAPTLLNQHLDQIHVTPHVDPTGTIHWDITDEGERTLASRALRGWLSVQAGHGNRLRACANDECAKFLIDRSKSNTARWCSMAVCGNRLKARRHNARKTSAPTESRTFSPTH